MRQVNPVAFKDVFHLEFKEILVSKNIAPATKNSVFLIVLQGVVQ
jgi:hypothetical protein